MEGAIFGEGGRRVVVVVEELVVEEREADGSCHRVAGGWGGRVADGQRRGEVSVEWGG